MTDTPTLTPEQQRDKPWYHYETWGWFGYGRSGGEIYLATKNQGRKYIMKFKRFGLNGAQPVFQEGGRGMVPAMDLVKFEVGDRSVTGIKEAAQNSSVYRFDIIGINNREAALIAAAPETARQRDIAVEALRDLLAGFDRAFPKEPYEGEPEVFVKDCVAAIIQNGRIREAHKAHLTPTGKWAAHGFPARIWKPTHVCGLPPITANEGE